MEDHTESGKICHSQVGPDWRDAGFHLRARVSHCYLAFRSTSTFGMSINVIAETTPSTAEPRLSNERKFIAPARSAELALTVLEPLLLPDGEYPVNTITSIYYETRDLLRYAEKSDGDNLKHKVRLRWYSSNDSTASRLTRAFLEVKFRVGSARHKSRHDLQLDRAWLESTPLTDPRLLDVLALAGEAEKPWMAPQLVPAVCISYDRHRYRCPYTGGRVAVDQHIRISRFHPELFPLGVPLELDATVCEYKDAAQVDIPWARHLYDAGFRLRSFSKFGEAIRLLQLGGAPA